MLPDIKDIARKRKQMGITQKELARLAMVSQSFIAKLESGLISPSYNNVKSIIEILENIEKEISEDTIEKRLYHKKIVFLSPEDTIYTAAKIMKKHKIHQIPVFDGGAPVGSITHRTIIDKMISAGVRDFSKIKIKLVMEEPFPIIKYNSPLSVVSELLKYNHAVLITNKSKIIGIVTKTDFIKSIK